MSRLCQTVIVSLVLTAWVPPTAGQMSDFWNPITTAGAPEARTDHTAVWTGTQMLIWGGLSTTGAPLGNGGRYDPATDSWTAISLVGAPSARFAHVAVWTGDRMFVWGGMGGVSRWDDGTRFGDGALYDPATDQWETISTIDAPGPRAYPAVAWNGEEVIVWGGHRDSPPPPPEHIACGTTTNTGARYTPADDSWIPMAEPILAASRAAAGAVWMDRKVLIHSGYIQDQWVPFGFGCMDGLSVPLTVRIYDADADGWIDPAPDPLGLAEHIVLWTGTVAIPWGGFTGISVPYSYDPVADDWTALSSAGMPDAGEAAWTGSFLISWGGGTWSALSDEGGIYAPECDEWFPTATFDAPEARRDHSAVWTGGRLLVWGGRDGTGPVATGGAYTPTELDGDLDGALTCVDNCPVLANPDQIDADADGLGDPCDVCPVDPLNDDDADGVCAAGDNCSEVANSAQTDADLDGRGNLCDNCIFVDNPAQQDIDADGAGDACDCQPIDPNDAPPPEVTLLSPDKIAPATIALFWPALVHADVYSVSRGDLFSLTVGASGSCLEEGITELGFADSDIPALDQGYFYLVQGQSFDCGLGTLGFDDDEQPRAGTCVGGLHSDVSAQGEMSVLGTTSGSMTDTFGSDNVAQSITEEETSGNPASRFSLLEHRWMFQVPAGSRVELHVEGWRTTSLDGDDFIFEFSTDGGINWNPLLLAGLPFADQGIDLVALLSPGIAGELTVRVIDTDRSAPNTDLDTVSVDQLFVRSAP